MLQVNVQVNVQSFGSFKLWFYIFSLVYAKAEINNVCFWLPYLKKTTQIFFICTMVKFLLFQAILLMLSYRSHVK